jgi:hypothetical protein
LSARVVFIRSSGDLYDGHDGNQLTPSPCGEGRGAGVTRASAQPRA